METVKLLTPTFVSEICARLGIRPTKQLGQNFVTDSSTVRKIVEAASVQAGQSVLEIGPGLGSLTLGLLEAGTSVSAVEIDPKLATLLPQTLAQMAPGKGDSIRVFQADALQISPAVLGDLAGLSERADSPFLQPEVLVSNLPYNVAVPVIINVLEKFPTIQRILVMVQKEVALRLAAQPGNRLYGVPSVKAAWWGKASLAGNISRNIFYPIPNVDSALVAITCEKRFDEELRAETFSLVDLAFSSRRKMLRSTLKNWVGTAAELEQVCKSCAIDVTARPETLSVADFYALVQARKTLLSE